MNREEWEQQLDSKIDQRVDKREQAKQEDGRIQKQATQAAYEEKFNKVWASTMTLNPWLLANQSLASMMMATKPCKTRPRCLCSLQNAPDELNSYLQKLRDSAYSDC